MPDRRVDSTRFAEVDGEFSGELHMHRAAARRILPVTFGTERRRAVAVTWVALVVVVAVVLSACKTPPIGTRGTAPSAGRSPAYPPMGVLVLCATTGQHGSRGQPHAVRAGNPRPCIGS